MNRTALDCTRSQHLLTTQHLLEVTSTQFNPIHYNLVQSIPIILTPTHPTQDDGHGYPVFVNKKSRETSFEDPRFEENEDEDTAAQRDFVMGEVRFAGYGMTNMSGCCLVS